jgi:hypothetical protein
MVMDLAYTPAELMARAIRDHWADCQVTLPELIRQSDQASVHFYLGGLNGMRKTLFPSLLGAYEQWSADRDWQILRDTVAQGAAHWSALGNELLVLHRQHGQAAARPIKELVEGSYL